MRAVSGFILVALVLVACSGTRIIEEEALEEEESGPAIAAEAMPYKPIADQFANALAVQDVATSYSLFASFTQSAVPMQEWQDSFNRYYEGFNKPTIPEVTMDPWEDDREWATMRAIPQDFPLENIKAEGVVYLGHPKGSDSEGFFVHFIVVDEYGQIRIAGPYIED